MPTKLNDYSNTIFYKIYCKDANVTDLYVGHTINFVQRKLSHKTSCKNQSASNHHCKLYNTIRSLGGWENWNMDIIAFHCCNDQYEARKKEQEYFLSLNATLNSIEPMPSPKEKPVKPLKINDTTRYKCDICDYTCVKLDVYNLHFTGRKHLKAVNLSTNRIGNKFKKYYCDKCDYLCFNKTNFNKHLQTDKHCAPECSIDAPLNNMIYTCECNNTYKHRQSYNRHKKICAGRSIDVPVVDTVEPQSETTQPCSQSVNTSLVLEIIKQNQDFNNLMIEQSKHLFEQQQQQQQQHNKLLELINECNSTV
jgi:hypothetical protein